MPFKEVKVKGGYVIRNLDTGKKYSKHPISKKNADAQLRILKYVTGK